MNKLITLLVGLVIATSPLVTCAEFIKNTQQVIHFSLFDAVDGSLVTSGTPVVYISKDGGTPAAATNAASYIGNNLWALTMTAAEWNATSIGVIITESGSAPVALQLTTISVDVAAIKTKTDFLPSATAGAAGGVFIAGSNASTTVNITGNLTGNVSGSVGSVTSGVAVGTGGITTGSFNAGAINAAAIAADAIGASELAADAVTEIQTGLATSTAVANVQTSADLALRPTTPGRTLNVTPTSHATVDLDMINGNSAVVDILQTHLAGSTYWTVDLIAGGIDADAIAIGAIDADAIATDAGTELATANWTLATRTITGGTITTYTGNTPQTGDAFARIGVGGVGLTSLPDVDNFNELVENVGNIYTRIGAPAGVSISADIAAIEAQTDDIGVAGAGLTAIGVTLSQDDIDDIVEGITEASTVSPMFVDLHNWRFDRGDELTSPITLYETVGFDGLLQMDFVKVIPKGTSIHSITQVTITKTDGTAVTTEVALGAAMLTPNKLSVQVPTEAVTAGDYIVRVKVLTVDNQTFARRGKLIVR